MNRQLVNQDGQERECIVYLESYFKVGDGIANAYIDFRQLKDFVMFRQITELPENSGSYIEFLSLKSSKRLMQGCYYKLNLNLLREFKLERYEDSLIIGGSYDMSKMERPEDEEGELLQRHNPLDPEEMSKSSLPIDLQINIPTTNNMSLFVKDVWQANWNELRHGDRIAVLYDAGAGLHAPTAEVESIFNSRKNDLEVSKPILVISHWDIDHIHCLKLLSQNDIPNFFSMLICVDRIKSMTAGHIYDNFKNALGPQKVWCVPPAVKTNGIDMHLLNNMGCISMYIGERSRNINYCGIAMFVKGPTRTANYTGDCRLSQAKSVYDQETAQGINTLKHVLVAPHHGGDCGAKHRIYSVPCDEIAISVGARNGYNHPHNDMLRYLRRLGNVKRTDIVGDILVAL